VQASVLADHPSGLFAGLFASSVDLGSASDANLETTISAGYARRVGVDRAWEVGAVYYLYPGSGSTSYAEGFAGLSWRDLNVRVYYTPDYFGSGAHELYVEAHATHSLSERAALFGHAGYARIQGRKSRVDVRLGVVIDLRVVNLEIAAVATNLSSADCPVGPDGCKPGVVVALSRSF
jgi:uncharacterized protein (TIGR02001 family)